MTTGGPAIDGVRFGTIARSVDERGSFRELWRASASDIAYAQANLSTSAPGVLRGLHLHTRQDDRWIVTAGRAFVALVDVRPLLSDPAALPLVATRELGPDETVDIPAGVAHGFLAIGPLELVYFVTNEYDGTDEAGFAWDDPAAAVAWPVMPPGGPILSARDAANPTLAELVVRLRT
jgi:dTDP-4-dehydrorhamnose 3,5-epimerase